MHDADKPIQSDSLSVNHLLPNALSKCEGPSGHHSYQPQPGLYFVRFSLGGQFRLAMTDRATIIAGMEVAKLVLWNSLLN